MDADRKEQLLAGPLSELSLSTRTINNLEENGGIRTVRQLLNKTREELLSLPNFGQCSLQEVLNALAAAGFGSGSAKRPARRERPHHQQWRRFFGN